jgi:ricin-type beta-trefoil lectin protein
MYSPPSFPPRERWLIPVAFGFLGAAVLFAVVMLVYPFGGGDPGGPPPPEPVAAPSRGAATASPTASASPVPSPTPSTDGALVRNQATGLCLSVAGGDPQGAAAQLDNCGNGTSQRWRRVGAGDGVTLVNVANRKCLDINDKSTDDKARAQTWSCNKGANQQWRLQPATGGTLLVSVNSGKCLEAPDGQGSPGTRLQQLTCNGRGNQVWVIGG